MRNILFDWLRRIFYNIYKYAYVDCKKASRCSHEIKTSSNSHEALYTIKGSQLLTKTLMSSIMLAKYQLFLTLRIMFGIGGSWACTISNCILYRNFGGQCFVGKMDTAKVTKSFYFVPLPSLSSHIPYIRSDCSILQYQNANVRFRKC